MAGAGYRQFTPGQILTAEQVQTYLQDQAVLVFNNSAARSSALGTFVSEGMLTYLKDTDALEVYDGANWDNVNDNTNAVLKSIFTAAGQLVYSSGSATPVALGAGQVGQYLQSNGTSVQWAEVEAGGGAVWFNFTYDANINNRWYYPLGSGLYWLEAFDKDGGTGPTGNVIAWNSAMSALATASLTANTAYGDSLARLNVGSSATYLSFSFNQDAIVVLTNAGSPVPVDAGGAPTIVTASTTVVLTQASNVYLLGGGGGGAGNQQFPMGGGGSGYLTTLTNVPAGTYSVTIGAGGAGSNSNGATGGATIFGTLGTAAGGQGANQANGGNGGSGGGSGSNQVPNTATYNGASGGVNGGNGGQAGLNPGSAGTGSGVTLPWFLSVQAAATAAIGSMSEGGRLYGGGAGGATNASNTINGGSATGYGGGGGGSGGVRNNGSSFTVSGGNGAAGVIFITAA